ncbi:multidrug efflux SMR transporter [Phyllobacterium sp. 21LDTY02-6]|uniref:DMT family transporter n=1 Tax=unclassified Phyllobacterium TaxID=2638441 RepID=UPI002021AAF1|nr:MULTISPECIES: multidrug efflux SMR transporter [unclassified Phyllobacterium]MCO4319832.1 multidrug efflux SMR transporter [Phyllobacterium sp. 21LDTY02-6]MCX8280572.1 multidrug efflux SMR transporter [Phyllobacterium sp. 0TCS1.6C]MCX8294979.1 multidrug efflux SMR transporter [Phyllobacterium sp. 0TCS1.6A]
MTYLYLLVAIVCEVIATSALKQADGFTRLWPSLICIAGYGAAFYLLSIPLKTMPVGIVYAIWSGAGIVLIAAVGLVWFKQSLDLAAVIGLALIIAGVLIVNLFSRTIGH